MSDFLANVVRRVSPVQDLRPRLQSRFEATQTQPVVENYREQTPPLIPASPSGEPHPSQAPAAISNLRAANVETDTSNVKQSPVQVPPEIEPAAPEVPRHPLAPPAIEHPDRFRTRPSFGVHPEHRPATASPAAVIPDWKPPASEEVPGNGSPKPPSPGTSITRVVHEHRHLDVPASRQASRESDLTHDWDTSIPKQLPPLPSETEPHTAIPLPRDAGDKPDQRWLSERKSINQDADVVVETREPQPGVLSNDLADLIASFRDAAAEQPPRHADEPRNSQQASRIIPEVKPESLPADRVAERPIQRTVNVTIGRIEVKSTSKQKPAPVAAQTSNAVSRVMTLDQYVRQRAEGGIA